MAKLSTDDLLRVDYQNSDLTISSKDYKGLYSKYTKAGSIVTDAHIENNDLVLTFKTRFNGNHKLTVTDYFKENGKSGFAYVVGSDSDLADATTYKNLIAYSMVDNYNEITGESLFMQNFDLKTGKGKMPSTVTGTAFNDTIDLSDVDAGTAAHLGLKKGFAIKGGDGNDDITGSALDDTITGGKGTTTVYANAYDGFGNDTIKLTNSEKFTATIDADDIDYTIDGKDIVATAYDEDGNTSEMRFAGLAAKNLVGEDGSVRVNGTNLLRRRYDTFLDEDNTKFTSTYLANNVYGAGTKALKIDLSKSEHSNTVNLTYASGNNTVKGANAEGSTDTVYDGRGNDSYTLGKGTNVINFNGSIIGENTVALTADENLTLNFADGVSYAVDGKDVVISNDQGSVRIKNFAAKDVGATVTVNGDNLANEWFDAQTWSADPYAKSFTGSRLNDYVDATTFVSADGKKGVKIDAKDGDNRIAGSKWDDTIKTGNGWDKVLASEGNDTYTLGLGHHNSAEYYFGGEEPMDYGTDTFNLTSGETLKLKLNTESGDFDYDDLSLTKVGNDIVVGYTTYDYSDPEDPQIVDNAAMVLKNMANGKLDANVQIQVNEGDAVSIWDYDIDVLATSATTNGTFGHDSIDSSLKKNTFVESYTKEQGFGSDTIVSHGENVKNDTIKITTADKKADKLAATDFNYELYDHDDDGTVFNMSSDKGSITYVNEHSAGDDYDPDEDAPNAFNLTIQDATNKKYNVMFGEDESVSLQKEKSNTIYMSAEYGINITDSKKDDIIVARGGDNSFTYTAGNDLYIGRDSYDTYSLFNGLTKKTALTIRDDGGEDTLNLGSTDIRNAGFYFNVGYNQEAGEYTAMDDDLIIYNRDSYLKGSSASSLIAGEAKGSVVIENYFGSGEMENVNAAGGAVDMGAKINQVVESVASWLKTNGNYTDSAAVFESGNKNDIQSLMNVYNVATMYEIA